MTHGRSIRIYLADGSASGIKHAELVNWTGQAMICPRTRISELRDWEESQRPGVYFLIGEPPEGSRLLVYVGEAENVYERLKQHVKDSKKDFFDQVLLLTSKDANLTKSHVKYLESRSVELIKTVDRVSLDNQNIPPRPQLPRADRDAMEEFLGPARLLMAALGFLALQPLSRRLNNQSEESQDRQDGPNGPLSHVTLYLTIPKRAVQATGLSTDEGFVIQKGSIGTMRVKPTLSESRLKYRDKLIEDGSITVQGDQMCFERDVLMSSPSAASSLLAGGVWGGRIGWKDSSGATLADLEGRLIG